MSGKTGYVLDFSKFMKNLDKIVDNIIPERAGKGLFNAANELHEDAKYKPPQTPKDIGDLWGSWENRPVKIVGTIIILVCGFNSKYAAKFHEMPPDEARKIQWTRHKGASQPGPKYLISKMIHYRKKYMGIIADSIRRGS